MVLKVLLCLECRSQSYLVRNVQFLEYHLQQVDVITIRFSVLVKEYVWPQVPCVFIYKWALVVVDNYAVFVLLSVGNAE